MVQVITDRNNRAHTNIRAHTHSECIKNVFSRIKHGLGNIEKIAALNEIGQKNKYTQTHIDEPYAWYAMNNITYSVR